MTKSIKIFLLISVIITIGVFIVFKLAPSGFFYEAAEWPYGIRLIKDDNEFKVYYNRASWVEEGLLPYAEVPAEYPQTAILYLSWPNILANNFIQYQQILLIGNLVCFLLLLGLCLWLLNLFKKNVNLAWLLFLPSAIYFTVNRFDIIPALLTILLIFFLLKKKYQVVFMLLAINFLLKWYALLFLPIIVLFIMAREKEATPIIKRGIADWLIIVA
ncbi:hypothetical protein KKI23_04255, partial [Patescibacteria group bacterium]|nr:hypothetical protein [Patescibacteria group bacterium]